MPHTPGQWKLIEDISLGPRGPAAYNYWLTDPEDTDEEHYIAYLDLGEADPDSDEARTIEANARLLAACPIMYEYIQKKAAEGDEDATKIINSI